MCSASCQRSGIGCLGVLCAELAERLIRMKKIDDKSDHGRMDVSRRERIVELGGIRSMTQERIKCPFCSELILRDAIKCRFCGEWFSMPDEVVEVGPTQESDPDEGGDHEHQDAPVGDIQGIFQSAEAILHGGSASGDANEGNEGQADERRKPVDASPVRVAREVVSAERLEPVPGLLRKGNRIPWIRAALLVLYLGAAAALVVSESGAQAILSDALKQEKAQEYDAALGTYGRILDAFPFSFATIETWKGVHRISQTQQIEIPKPSWLVKGEKLLGRTLAVQEVHLLPFVAWPAGAILLFLVFLTRIFRPGVALLAILLTIVALAGSVAQSAWYGLIPLTPVVDVMRDFMQESVTVYFASCLLMLLTVLMTLTAATRRPSLRTAKMATAAARIQ